MASEKTNRDQHGRTKRRIHSDGRVEFYYPMGTSESPIPPEHPFHDSLSWLHEIIREMKEHPCRDRIGSYSSAESTAVMLMEELQSDSPNMDFWMCQAITLGIDIERARNELKPSVGGKSFKIPERDLPAIKREIDVAILDGRGWTQVTSTIAERYKATGKALRDRLLKENYERPKKPKKTSRNSGK
jgi:hypothetical protein